MSVSRLEHITEIGVEQMGDLADSLARYWATFSDCTEMTNTDSLIEFASLEWASPAQGVRVKEAIRGEHRIRLIEFAEEFEETDWCKKDHIAFVIDGELEIEFDGRIVRLKAGDGLFIPPGESSKHKARVPRGKATLFVVETAESS